MNKRAVTFGEIMMRLTPPGFQRITQARSFDVIYGGSEANVAVSLANYGIPVDFVTRLPNNDLGQACTQFINQYGVDTKKIIRGGDRLGIYFLEIGAAQRAGKVIYDRAYSSMATIKPGMIDWASVFADADWFHWTGITPAISEGAASVCLEAIKAAKDMGLTVSCDINLRKNLWKWGKSVTEVMPELIGLCDVVIGNEEHIDIIFGIKAPPVSGKVDASAYEYVCSELTKELPSLKQVVITLRGSLSATHNTLSGILYESGRMHVAKQYDIAFIVDRVGGGDAFTAGIIYGIKTYNGDFQKTIDFAVAAGCLKHSIVGDFNLVTVEEVEKLMDGDSSGRVRR